MQRLNAVQSFLIAISGLTAVVQFAGAARAADPTLLSIEAEATQFKITLTDGRVLRSPELAGAALVIGTGDQSRRLRIDAVEIDPDAPGVYLHTLSTQGPDETWANICEPGPDGRRQAFPIAGRAEADSTISPAAPGIFEITCTGGAQGKCVRFGYHPWENATDGLGAFDLYNACVRLVRADYSGDGKGTTRNGMSIDIFDFIGIQSDEPGPGMEFEAGWTKDGAVCVRHPRVKENVSLDALDALPALRGRTGDVCTEEFARAHGATLFNRSRP